MKYSLGFSPCPNDTFIFDALVNGKIDTKGLQFEFVMEDVETLNQWAFDRKLDITKLSFNTILKTLKDYVLLDSGSALGSGVGPLLITKHKLDINNENDLEEYLTDASIAIPGENTTANLLLTLAFPNAKHKKEIVFSEIEQEVLNNRFDCGLVIHESRFTYAERGLHKLLDMGEWWEQQSGAAIPLGGICVRKDIPNDTARYIEQLIRESITYSWQHYPELSDFVKINAQEMKEDVMRKHIELYVNDYTTSLGDTGRKAIGTLITKAVAAGMLHNTPETIFI